MMSEYAFETLLPDLSLGTLAKLSAYLGELLARDMEPAEFVALNRLGSLFFDAGQERAGVDFYPVYFTEADRLSELPEPVAG